MTWHDHNRSMWRQNHWDVFRSLAAEGDRERLERLLIPLRGNHAELLVEKADRDRREFAAMLNRTVEEYEDALRAMFSSTRTLAEVLALPCGWCGEQSCQQREEHRRLNAQREQTWREPTDGAAGLPPHGPAAHPNPAEERLAAYATFAVRVDAILTFSVGTDAERLQHIADQFAVLRRSLAEGGAGADGGVSAPARGPKPLSTRRLLEGDPDVAREVESWPLTDDCRERGAS